MVAFSHAYPPLLRPGKHEEGRVCARPIRRTSAGGDPKPTLLFPRECLSDAVPLHELLRGDELRFDPWRIGRLSTSFHIGRPKPVGGKCRVPLRVQEAKRCFRPALFVPAPLRIVQHTLDTAEQLPYEGQVCLLHRGVHVLFPDKDRREQASCCVRNMERVHGRALIEQAAGMAAAHVHLFALPGLGVLVAPAVQQRIVRVGGWRRCSSLLRLSAVLCAVLAHPGIPLGRRRK